MRGLILVLVICAAVLFAGCGVAQKSGGQRINDRHFNY